MLNSYLRETKGQLHRFSSSPHTSSHTFNFISGNQAADTDSIVSALVLAFTMSKSKSQTHKSLKSIPIHIPILSLHATDLALRPDTSHLLSLAKIDTSSLTFMDDPLASNNFAFATSITLTDHNTLNSNIDASKVVEIIDHHKDDGNHDNVKGKLRDIAFDASNSKALVGSCCTQVAERYLDDVSPFDHDESIALLLLGTILLDTMNMSPTAGKGTLRDQAAITRLSKVSERSSLQHNTLFVHYLYTIC